MQLQSCTDSCTSGGGANFLLLCISRSVVPRQVLLRFLVQDPTLGKMQWDDEKDMRERYQKIFHGALFQTYPETFNPADFTYNLYKHTVLYYDARVFELDDFNPKKAKEAQTAKTTIIPLVQLMNHNLGLLLSASPFLLIQFIHNMLPRRMRVSRSWSPSILLQRKD